MSELMSMMNIGKEMEKKLISVGIESSEKLITVDAKDAFSGRRPYGCGSAWKPGQH